MRLAITPEEIGQSHTVYWGCKALVADDKRLILLSDRQILAPSKDSEKNEKFMAWLRTKAVPWLKTKVQQGLKPTETIALEEDNYLLQGSHCSDANWFYLGAIERNSK
jgi:hypothetical protein